MKALLMLITLLLFACQSHATEILRWEKIPLAIDLTVGQERVIFTEHSVSVGLPSALNGKLRVQSADGAVYIQASSPFPSSRVLLKDVQNGSLILLDIKASDGNTQYREPVKIITDTDSNSNDNMTATPADRKPRRSTPVAILLTRYAAQTLYAPPRTVEAVPGITPLPLHVSSELSALYPASPLVFRPLAAWGMGGVSVIAIEVRNRASDTVVPDPRLISGNFTSATFQHRWLGAAGTPEDTTVLYLVTQGRPEQAFIAPPLKKQKIAKKTAIRNDVKE